MSKVYRGYELIKAIADGEIKENTYIKVHDLSVVDIVIEEILYSDGKLNWEPGGFDTSYLFNPYYVFEPMENEEIDIDNIEKLDIDQIINTDDKTGIALLHINKLVQAVKQLNKEIKELKEK